MGFFWFLLILVSVFTYTMLNRNVRPLTRTPIWLLWIVLMLPAFIWTTWLLIQGPEAPFPILLLLLPLVVCPIIYWNLLNRGRKPISKDSESSVSDSEPATATSEAIARQEIQARLAQQPKLPRLTQSEEADLQSCFPWSVYYLQNVEYRQQAVVCRGQLRTSSETAYETIRKNIQEKFRDRFLLLFQEGVSNKPFFVLVPTPASADEPSDRQRLFRPIIAAGLLLATLLTTVMAGGVLMSGDLQQAREVPSAAQLLQSGLPYGITLMLILGVHEFGHYFAAQCHRIKSTLPYFIPVPPAPIFPFGTFGAFIQMRSPVPNRRALFDVGVSGPLSGLVVTIPALIWGIAHSTLVPVSEDSSILNFQSLDPSASFLLMLLSKLALGSQLTAEQAIELHPVAIAGCLGLVVTALNLMPVGQLDGGHIVHAMFGQRIGSTIGQIARILVLLLSFIQREFFIWAIILFFLPSVDEPALNDVSELDNRRDFIGLLSLALLIMIVLPAPPTLTQWLL